MFNFRDYFGPKGGKILEFTNSPPTFEFNMISFVVIAYSKKIEEH